MEDFDGRCAYCGSPATTWDHIVPVSKGGSTTPSNVVPACASCNSSKNDRDVAEWMTDKGLSPSPDLMDRIAIGPAWGH
jgi:5-methylcytosine-specific restriction endonuclease McrA